MATVLLFDFCVPAGRSLGGLTEQLAGAVAEGVRFIRLDDAGIGQFAQRIFP